MKYFILNNDQKEVGKTYGAWGCYNTQAEAEAIEYSFNAVVVPFDTQTPERAQFLYNGSEFVGEERALTTEEIKAAQNWEGLEDDLEGLELVDSPGETFFSRAFTDTPSNNNIAANAYTLLLNCFGANKWDARLAFALPIVHANLNRSLTANETAQLNTILSNNGFNFTV